MHKILRKKIHHWNTPGHAHELTFSCHRRSKYFTDAIANEMLIEELEKSLGQHVDAFFACSDNDRDDTGTKHKFNACGQLLREKDFSDD